MKRIRSSNYLLILIGIIGLSFNILYAYTNLFATKDAPRVKQTYAASAGPNSPTTITSDVVSGGTTWTNPTNALTSNNSYATNTGTSTYYLSTTGYGFAIPATAIVNYFTVEVEGKSSVGSTPFFDTPCIIIAGVRTCNGATGSQIHFSTTEQYMQNGIDNTWRQYGNASYPVTAAQVNASNFGFAIQVVNTGGETISIDHVRVTVNYTAQAAPVVTTGILSTIHDTDAVLKGTIGPSAQSTNGFFKWGTSNSACSSLTNTTSTVALGTGNGYGQGYVDLGTAITGLSANTTYYYCIAATNASGTTYGSVYSFTTTGGANPIQSVSAVPGTISGQGASCPSRAGWTNPSNVSTSDNVYATGATTYPSPNCGNTGDLTFSNFGFNIPAGSSVLGIAVDVEGKYTAGSDSFNVRVYQNAPSQTGVWGQTYPIVNTVESIQTSGGPSDMIGGAWTSAIVNSSSFGFLMQNSFIGTTTYSVDQVRLTVYYSSNPTITSPTKASIGGTTATLGGNVTSQGASSITGRGVCYSSSDSTPQLSEGGVTCVSTSGTTGVFTVPVNNLNQVTNYYYTAYATNSQGTSYTSVDSFTTLNVNPTGVGTDPGSNVNSYFVTLNGVANPNGYPTVGHFRVFDYNPTNCNSDANGAPAGKNNFRFPPIAPQDISVGSDTSPHNFTFTIPYNSNNFLYPNTKYWYCSYAVNDNGTVGGASVQTFVTSDGPASPCDAPASGSLSIPVGAACRFSGDYNGVDAGTGGTNTATLTLNTGNQITLNPGQKIGRGTLSLRGGSLTLAAGSSIVRGGVFVHDKDGDGVLDDAIQYVGSTASASTEFVRRNTMSTTLFNYSWKIASGGATFDCNQNSAYVNRYVPGIQMVTDADNDGYKTSAAASTQCVGQQSVINGRTYYKDASNSYTWLASTAVLGGGATDCQDDPNGGPCAPSSLTASNPTSQTQNTLSWSGTQTGGAVPATTAYDVQWCPGVACSPPTGGGTLSNFASGSDHTGLSASTTYGYKVAAKNGAIVGTYSGVQYATTQAACTNTTIYPDTDGDTYGNSGTIYQGAVVQKYNNTSASSITITKPADIVNGELMIAVIGWGGGSNRSITSVPSGWTQIGATATNGTATNIAAYYKYASGEGANYTWDFSSSEQQTGFITSYGNAILSPSNPVDVSSTSTGTSTNLTVTGISLNSANEMLVMAVGANPGAASVTFNSAPAGMNEIAKINSSTSESGGAGDILAGYSEWRSSGGATGDKTAVISGSKAYAGIIFALKRPAQVSDVQCLTGGPPGGWALNSNDCDDTTSNYYQTQLTSRIQDFDTDGQGIGSQITVCKGASTRPGTTTNTNLDCYDNNANAYVGQSTYFTSGRGDGSFDYDCNAANDRNPSIISSAEYYSGSSSCLSGTCNKSSRDSTNSCFVVDPTCSGGYNMCNFLGTPVSSSTSCGLILQAKLYDDQACTNWGGVITLSFAHIMSCK